MKKPKMPGVYKIQSKIEPDKFYVGSSVSMNDRWSSHKERIRSNKDCCPLLGNYARKHGIENMEFIILEQFDFISVDHLLGREQFYIDTLNPTLNISKDTRSRYGTHNSEEGCLNISKSKSGINNPRLGITMPQETRDKISVSNTGKTLTKEHKEKLSKAKKGKIMSDETRLKRGLLTREDARIKKELKKQEKKNKPKKPPWNKGLTKATSEKLNKASKKMSESKKGKISPNIGRKASPETILKLINSHIGIKPSQESINKRSASMKIVWANRKLLNNVR